MAESTEIAPMNAEEAAAYAVEEEKYYMFQMSLGPVERSTENVRLFYNAIANLLKRPTQCEILITHHFSLICVYRMKKCDFGDMDWTGREWRNDRGKLRILNGYHAGKKEETRPGVTCYEIVRKQFPIQRGTKYWYKEAVDTRYEKKGVTRGVGEVWIEVEGLKVLIGIIDFGWIVVCSGRPCRCIGMVKTFDVLEACLAMAEFSR